jgi:hypothetical protein
MQDDVRRKIEDGQQERRWQVPTVRPGIKLDHSFTTIFAPVAGKAFDDLVASVAKHGQKRPVVLHEDQILDGRALYRALVRIGSEIEYIDYDGHDPEGYVIAANAKGRLPNTYARAFAARAWLGWETYKTCSEFETTFPNDISISHQRKCRRGGDRRSANRPVSEKSLDQAAELFSVNKKAIVRVDIIENSQKPELAAGARLELISIGRAATLAKDPEEADAVISEWLRVAIMNREADPERRKRWAKRATAKRLVTTKRQVEIITRNQATTPEEREVLWRWAWDSFGPARRDRLVDEVIVAYQTAKHTGMQNYDEDGRYERDDQSHDA